MAKDQRWTRYRPPSEKRGEDGRSTSKKPLPPKATSSTSGAGNKSSAGKTAADKKAGRSTTSTVPWLVALLVVGVIVVITVVVAKVGGGDDELGDNPEIERKTLTVQFLADALALAEEKNDTDPVSLRLSDYNLAIEYFDPTAQEISRFQFDTYSKGYRVTVDENPYSDYRPPRFPLSMVSPQALIDAADAALAKSSNASYFDVTVEADPETGEVAIVASVSGDERVEVTSEPLTTPTGPTRPSPEDASTIPSDVP